MGFGTIFEQSVLEYKSTTFNFFEKGCKVFFLPLFTVCSNNNNNNNLLIYIAHIYIH